MLYHTFYTSRAQSAFPGLVDFDILRAAWAHNQLAGIGGYLLRTGQAYFQWLEGPRDPVLRLMERIARDDRHSDVTVIAEGTLPERQFANWVMGYHELSEDEARRLAVAAPPRTDDILDILREKARLRLN